MECRPDKSLSEADHTWLWPALSQAPAAVTAQASCLAHIVADLALGSHAAAVRKAACNVVLGLWRYLLMHGKRKQAAAVLLVQTLLGCLPQLAAYGKAALEVSQLITSLLEGPSHPHEAGRPKAAAAEAAEDQPKGSKTGMLCRF